MNEFFYPKLQSVQALEPHRLRTMWSIGEVVEIDVEPILRKFSFDEVLGVDNVFA